MSKLSNTVAFVLGSVLSVGVLLASQDNLQVSSIPVVSNVLERMYSAQPEASPAESARTIALRQLSQSATLTAEQERQALYDANFAKGQQAAAELDLAVLNAKLDEAAADKRFSAVLEKVTISSVPGEGIGFSSACGIGQQGSCMVYFSNYQKVDPRVGYYNGYVAKLTELLEVEVVQSDNCTYRTTLKDTCELTLTADWGLADNGYTYSGTILATRN